MVFTTPTPPTLALSSAIGPSIPGNANDHGMGAPILATPRGTAFLFVCVVPACAITIPFCTSACARSMSPPNLSSSENNIGSTIMPAPASRSRHITSASTVLFQGHCPFCSMLFSSISTITTSSLIVGVSYFCIRSKLLSLAVSFTNGSLRPHVINTASVMKAKVQCVSNFFIWECWGC